MTETALLAWLGAVGGCSAVLFIVVYWIYQCCINHKAKHRQESALVAVREDLSNLTDRIEVIITASEQVENATKEAATKATRAAVTEATADAIEIVSRQCQHGMEMSKELTEKMQKVGNSLQGIMLQSTELLCNTVRTTVNRAATDATATAHRTAKEQWEIAFKEMSTAAQAATDHARIAGDACVKASSEFQQLVIDTQDLTKAAVNDVSSVQTTAKEAVALSNEAAEKATAHMEALSEVLENTHSATTDAVQAVRDAQDEMIRSIQKTMNDMNSRGAQELDETMRQVMQANMRTIDRTLLDLSHVAITMKELVGIKDSLENVVEELKHGHRTKSLSMTESPDNSGSDTNRKSTKEIFLAPPRLSEKKIANDRSSASSSSKSDDYSENAKDEHGAKEGDLYS